MHFSVVDRNSVSRLWNDNFVGSFCTRSCDQVMSDECRRNDVGTDCFGDRSVVVGVRRARELVCCATCRLGTSASVFSGPRNYVRPMADSNLSACMEMTAL